MKGVGERISTWNYRNRLITAGNGSSNTIYGYNHVDQRVSSIDNGITTHFPNQYYSKEGATTTIHIFAGGDTVGSIEMTASSQDTRFTHTDHLGSTHIVSDSNGDVVQELDYLPFGAERIAIGKNITDRNRREMF